MAEKFTDYKCPACGGTVAFRAAEGKLKCDFCGSLYTVAEMKALYEKRNEEVVADAAQQAVKSTSADEWGEDAAGMKIYHCNSCGAELACDETTAATSCPYCGNTAIMPQQFKGMQRPRYVIPFKVEKKEAQEKLKSYYKGKRLLPSSFSDQNHIQEIKGVFVPFWLYSGKVDADMTFEGVNERVTDRGDERITETEVYRVHRRGVVLFDKVPTDASSKMPDDLMDSIEPFDYRELRDFEMEYLPGYLADKYDVSKEESLSRAQKRAEHSTVQCVRGTVKGYDRVTEESGKRKLLFSETRQEYAMLPVWLLSTRWEDRNFLFAINGQTGRMTGDLPIARGKLAAWILGISLPVLALLLWLLGTGTTRSVVMAVGGAVLAGIITALVLVSQMKPVSQRSGAGEYIGGSDKIQLSVKEDRYIKTTEKRERISR